MGSTWEVSKKYIQLTNCTPRQCTTRSLSSSLSLSQFIFCQSGAQRGRTQVSIIFLTENMYEMRFPDCKRALIGRAVSKLDKKSHFLTALPSLLTFVYLPLSLSVSHSSILCANIFQLIDEALLNTHNNHKSWLCTCRGVTWAKVHIIFI